MQHDKSYRYLQPEYAEGLKGLRIQPRRPLKGDFAGAHKSAAYGASVEFADYREYTPGDSADLIDWAVYARSDRYVIRRYEEETSIRGYILLDSSGSMGYAGAGATMSKWEYACNLAAGMMYVLVNQHDSAGLGIFSDKMVGFYPPAHQLALLGPQLKALEECRPEGASDIESVLHDAAELFSPKSLVVLISDLLERPEKIMNGLSHLHFLGHEVMVMHVMDGSEVRLMFDGMSELEEIESARRMQINADEIREAYREAVEHYVDCLRSGCASLGVDYSLNETSVPAIEAVHRRSSRQ